MAHGPEPGTILNEGEPDGPPAGGHGRRPARRRRAARGADGAAHAEGPVHGRRVGLPGRRGRRARGRGRRRPPRRGRPRGLRGGRDHAPRPRRARPVRALDHAARGRRSASTPTSSSPSRRSGAEAVPDGSEIVDARWFAPARALEGSEAGELLMVFPTIKNLEVLARFETADALLEWAATHEVRPVQPRVEGHGETARIVLDDDDEPDGRRHRADGRDRARVPARAGAPPRVGRVLGMARRAFDPSALGLTQDRVPPGRRARPRGRRRARPSEADVLVHLAFIIMGGREETRAVNLTGSRNVFARGAAARRQAARLHVVGRRLRLPRRQPAAADRGRPAARQRALLLLGAEGRARARARGGDGVDRPRGLRAAAVHRRRARTRRCCGASSRSRPGRCRRCCPLPGRRSSSSTTTTSPPRSSRRRAVRARPAPTTWRATGR